MASVNQSADGPDLQVLLVEDEPEIRELVGHVLRKHRCNLYFARSGEEALRLSRTQHFDLILLDIVLPVSEGSQLDGVSLCRILRKDKDLAKIPIYMVTAKKKRIDEVESLRAGATGYIQKPFDNQKLVDIVEALGISK